MKKHTYLNKASKLVTLAVLGTLVSACGSTKIRPFSDTNKPTNLTKAEKRYWYEADETFKRIRNSGLLISDDRLDQYLNGIAKRLYPEYADYVTVRVVDSPSYNAFVMPNGDIYIHSAMLATLQNEAQLAMIVSHELAHFVRKHGAINANKFENGMAAGAVVNTVIPLVGLIGQGIAVTSMYGMSRDSEREADTLGFERYIAAGYPAKEAVKAFYVLQEESQLGQDKDDLFMFASHPKLQERIDSVNRLIEQSSSDEQIESMDDPIYTQMTAALSDALPLSLYENGRYEQLLKLLNNARRKVDNEPFFKAMAMLRTEQKTFSEVEDLFLQQIETYPEFADPYREYGYLLASNDRASDAVKMLDKYLLLKPESINKWFVIDKLKQLKNNGN